MATNAEPSGMGGTRGLEMRMFTKHGAPTPARSRASALSRSALTAASQGKDRVGGAREPAGDDESVELVADMTSTTAGASW